MASMRVDHDLAAAVDRSFIGSYRTLAEHADGGEFHDGPVVAFTTGLPLGLFNGAIATDDAATPADLEAAIDWLEGLGLPYRVFIGAAQDGRLGDVPRSRGLRPDGALYPGMAIEAPDAVPSRAAGVEVRAVASAADLDQHVGLLVEQGVERTVAARLLPPAFAADADVRMFTAFLEGRPVGTSVAIRTGEVAGVYGVATLPEARRRGVGTAATWAAVEAGVSWGCRTVVLQSTEMGRPVYEAMGFRTVTGYVTYRARAATRSSDGPD